MTKKPRNTTNLIPIFLQRPVIYLLTIPIKILQMNNAPVKAIINKKFLCTLVLLSCFFSSSLLKAQGNIHQQSTQYEWPSDPLVKEKLEQWRDQKFGMIIHYGLYAVPGIMGALF